MSNSSSTEILISKYYNGYKTTEVVVMIVDDLYEKSAVNV